MGKSWRRDAKNDGWRKAKQQKQNGKWTKPRPTDEKFHDVPQVYDAEWFDENAK